VLTRTTIRWTCQARIVETGKECGWNNITPDKQFAGKDTKATGLCRWCGCSRLESELRIGEAATPLEGSYAKRLF
jgi:hypothetical protein